MEILHFLASIVFIIFVMFIYTNLFGKKTLRMLMIDVLFWVFLSLAATVFGGVLYLGYQSEQMAPKNKITNEKSTTSPKQ